MEFPVPPNDTAVSLTEEDVDETENKYARRKPVGFIGKLMKAHEIHPKYKVVARLVHVQIQCLTRCDRLL